MYKKSLGGRLSANPVRISLIEKEERRRTQTLKSRPSSLSDDTHIPRPRVRSSSVDTTNRKSGLKAPGRLQHSQYGFGTPQATATTPRTSQCGSTARSLLPPGSSIRARSPSAERASMLVGKITSKDNRPLGDKSFQNEMLSKIDCYLRSIDQSALVNNSGSLRPITLKMFVEVSDLLVKLLDVKQSLTMVNYVEELPKIAKKLHYPGQMNKSWLKTANTMHSWPQVLGWLSWLVEACICRDIASDYFQLDNLPFIDSDNGGSHLSKLKLQFLLNAYKSWNDEKADEEKALTEEFLQAVSDSQGVSEAEIEKISREYEQELALLEQAKKEGERLDEENAELEKTLKSIRLEEFNQDVKIKELEDAEQKHLAEASKFSKETKLLEDTLQQQKIRQEELKVQIMSQPMSIIQRDEILDQCEVMENQIKEFDKHTYNLNKELYALDVKLTSAKKNLMDEVFAYNQNFYLHFGSESGINVLDTTKPLTGQLDSKIMDELQEKSNQMSIFRQNLDEQNKIKIFALQADQEKLEALEEEKSKLEVEEIARNETISENKKRIKSIKAAAKAKEAELKEVIEKLKQNIKDMELQIPDVEQEVKDLAEAKEKIQALKQRKAYFEESAKLFFDKFFQILANHNNRLSSFLKDAKENNNFIN